GLFLLPHLHNADAENPTPGIPLRAEDYRRCFAHSETRLLRETDVLDGFVRDGRLDLAGEHAPAALADAAVFSLVAARSKDAWQGYDGLDDILLGDDTRT